MARAASLDRAFLRRVLIVLAVGTLAFVAWRLADLLLLVFGAVLLAVLLGTLSRFIERHAPLSGKLAYAAAILLVVAAVGLTGWLFGAEVKDQAATFFDTLPRAWESFLERLRELPGGELLVRTVQDANVGGGTGVLARMGSAFVSVLAIAVDTFLIVFGGIFIGAQPGLYFRGLVMLFPEGVRERARETLELGGYALRRWLLGQLVLMVTVGVLTGVGLWLAGVPSALALGVLAGVTEFIPYIGPILAAIPGLLIALSEGPQLALWALLVYVGVQQLEGNVILPLVERRVVAVPPALTLFAVAAMGLLFGPLGLFFATPLVVLAYVTTKKLYVRETLGERVDVPGEGG